MIKNCKACQVWWPMPLISALESQRQENICEFKVSLVNKTSSGPARGYIMRFWPRNRMAEVFLFSFTYNII